MRDFFEFKWKFLLSYFFNLYKKRSIINKYLFVSHTGSINWIIGAQSRRLSRNFVGDSEVFNSDNFKNIPIAKGYFFLHQKYFAKALRYNPHLRKSKVIVKFTHPEWNRFYSERQARYTMKYASKVICLNKRMKDDLIKIGIESQKIEIYHLTSDPEFFPEKSGGKGNTVGFCSAYYERKNPELIFNLVKKMQDIDFILVGRYWENYPKYEELMKQPNFTYYNNLDYKEYPAMYQKMDVYLSPAFLEGGPVPLLEAMLTNVIPVASDTGFCPDIIRHGENGFLFDPHNDSDEYVSQLIRKALKLDVNVRKDVEMHSWKEYGRQIYELFESID